MSSIIMHIYISQVVKNQLNLSNKFLAGSILPDMIKLKTKNWYLTHYASDGLPDLDNFLDVNKDKLKDEVTLGYYAHLIEDKIWFEKYTNMFIKYIDKETVRYIKDNTIHNITEFYSEYDKIDNYLIKQNKMDIDNIRNELKKQLKEYDVDEEIDKHVVQSINFVDTEVRLISDNCLNDYINESVETVLEEIIKILGE